MAIGASVETHVTSAHRQLTKTQTHLTVKEAGRASPAGGAEHPFRTQVGKASYNKKEKEEGGY